jgi:hypothetical protein
MQLSLFPGLYRRFPYPLEGGTHSIHEPQTPTERKISFGGRLYYHNFNNQDALKLRCKTF